MWNQIIPHITGTLTRAAVGVISQNLPDTSSPFISGHALRSMTPDGALKAGVLPSGVWAKYAVPKGLPSIGSRSLAIENDPHEANDFSGEIKEGYGKGTKTLLLSDNVIVKVGGRSSVQKINYHIHDADKAGLHYDIVVTGIKPGERQWEMNIPRGSLKGRYAFVQTARGMLITPMTDRGLRLPKPAYTLRKEDLLTEIDPSKVIVERKVDGSLGNAAIEGRRVAFRSHREGGETYYDKLPGIESIESKSSFLFSRLVYAGPELSGTVLQGELVHPEGAARVAGILNSLAPGARSIQEERGPITYCVWDIQKFRGRDVSGRSYAERRILYRDVVHQIRTVNKNWSFIEAMGDDETPKSFYDRVTSDPLPWGEGIVIKPRDLSLQKWDKIKMTGFGYFKLHDILPGEGKYVGSVGRLVVENKENGALGEVGSLAVPDEYRNWIWLRREDLIGETIKVRCQEVTSRGVPRAGVFYGFHDSEVDLLMAAEAAAGSTDPVVARPMMYRMKSANGWRAK